MVVTLGVKAMNRIQELLQENTSVIDEDMVDFDLLFTHQINTELTELAGETFFEHFKDEGITKIVTIETSGIAFAYAAALRLNVPVVFIKKTKPSTMMYPYHTKVYSTSKNKSFTLCLGRDVLKPEDKVLFIDDILANGESFLAIERLIENTGAKLAGAAIVVEKTFQDGAKIIREELENVCVLASISEIADDKIIWS